MIEGFLLGVLFTWPSFAIMCILAVIAESLGKTKTAVALVILSMIAVYILTSVSLATVLVSGVGYLVVGILWSFWRYKKYVRDAYKEAYEEGSGYPEGIRQSKIDSMKKYTTPDRLVDKILSWIVIWPLSLISVALGDTVYLLKQIVQKHLKDVYVRIHSNIFKDL